MYIKLLLTCILKLSVISLYLKMAKMKKIGNTKYWGGQGAGRSMNCCNHFGTLRIYTKAECRKTILSEQYYSWVYTSPPHECAFLLKDRYRHVRSSIICKTSKVGSSVHQQIEYIHRLCCNDEMN